MITKLTDQQISRFPEFVSRWTDIGLCTDPADRERAEAGIRMSYVCAGLAPPKSIVWCGSPLSQGLTRVLWASVWDSVADSVRDSVGASVSDSMWASVADSVRDSVWASVGDSVGDSVRGQHDAGWLAFYEYMCVVCGLCEETQKLKGLWEVSQSANWWIPHEGMCWVSERHNVVRRNSEGALHCNGGPALSYPDDWRIWSLNGVRVPQWLAETPSEQIDPQRVISQSNVEVRREGVHKVGVDRLVYKLGATSIEKCGQYELLQIDLGLGTPAIALKMKNPSVPEIWHIEFIDPTCRTVQEALNFRNGLSDSDIDDDGGADWYQQGDVIMRPHGAVKCEARPIVLK